MTFTADDIAASIAQLDRMISRCDALVKTKLKPIKPDMSLPRYEPPPVKVVAPAPSFDPQQRFDQIRREHRRTGSNGYRPICTGSFGADVDAAFEACSSAPI